MSRLVAGFVRALSVAAICGALPAVHAATPAARFDGKPQFTEGNPLGYFVWREGRTWKLRWTAFGTGHRFTGHVVAEGGEFSSFTRIDSNAERRLIRTARTGRAAPGSRTRVRPAPPGRESAAQGDDDSVIRENAHEIRFAAGTDDDIDGFDFTLTERTVRLSFRLEIDGTVKADEIEIGARNLRPGEDPLVAVMR